MMMNIFAKSIALAGLVAVSSVVGESVRAVTSDEAALQQQQQQRRLDDNLCLMCELCDALSDLCDLGLIQDFACITCDDDDDDDDDPDTDICFSERATVQVLQHQKEIAVQMKDLQVGDQIRTTGSTNNNKYETVYAFGHNNPTRTATFYQIYNEQSTNPLEITADHMVFLHNNDNDKQTPVAASTLQVGDVLASSNGPSKVTKISTVERTGIYAPLTTGGTLLVDGVKASSYIAVGQQKTNLLSDHTLIHVTLSPYRMICTGISQQFCKPESYNNDGMPYYVEFGLNLLHWMNSSSNYVLKALVFGAVVTSTGALFSLELLFGSSLAPLMIFIAAVAYMSQRNNKNKKSKAKAL